MVGAAALLVLTAETCWARQHLIEAGVEWSRVASEIKPGDEIILLPGRHRPASLPMLAGTAENPIVIRSLTPELPGVIAAGRYGLELRSPRYVKLQDFAVTGAVIAGILIDDPESETPPRLEPAGRELRREAGPGEAGGDAAPEPESPPVPEHLLLQRINVTRTGPQGDRDAVRVIGASDVRFEGCAFEGWAGAAIELIACRDVTIDNCTFRGLPDHSQTTGLLVRAGSEHVIINRCRFDATGFYGVVVGGASPLSDFRPALVPAAPEPAPPEASAATSAALPVAPVPAPSSAPPVNAPAPPAPQGGRDESAAPKPDAGKAPSKRGYSSRPRGAIKGAPPPQPNPPRTTPGSPGSPSSPGPSGSPALPAPEGPTSPPSTPRPVTRIDLLFEAIEVSIERCMFVDCAVAIGAMQADLCQVRNNTIVRPQRGVLALAAPQTDSRFSRGGRVSFTANLIAGALTSMPALAFIQPPAETALFQLGQNLWWCEPGTEADQAALATLIRQLPSQTPAPQILDVNPQLDGQLKLTNQLAVLFGPEAP